MIPDKETCLKILEKHNAVGRVMEHSKMVAKVAVFLAKELKKTGEKIDVNLLEAAALLHDIDKLQTLDNDENHGIIGSEMLAKDYPEVSQLVRNHIFSFLMNNGDTSWEQKILNYSDARVQEDEVVSLNERFEYGRNRYPDQVGDKREQAEEAYRIIEREIFKKIKLHPDRLEKAIANQKEKQKKLRNLRKKQKEAEQKQEEAKEEQKESAEEPKSEQPEENKEEVKDTNFEEVKTEEKEIKPEQTQEINN